MDIALNMSRFRSLAAVPLVSCLIVLHSSGCSDDSAGEESVVYPVTGTVTMDGAAFGPALIQLSPLDTENGRVVGGEVDAQGNLKLSTHAPGDGAPAGEYKVVFPPDPLNRAPKPIPSAYQTASSSPITVKVEESETNSLTVALDSKAVGTSAGRYDPTLNKNAPGSGNYPTIDPSLMPKTGP